MRLGILGGTFDPVHYGHLLMAERCREVASLDRVWLMPASTPPHKQGRDISSPKDRIAMLELAVAGCPEFEVSRLEVDRKGTSYTFETLEQIVGDQPGVEPFLIIGADSLNDLPTWREPQRILELAMVLAVNRGRTPPPTQPLRKALGDQALSRINLVDMPAIDLSATDIRTRTKAGESIRFMTPRPVAMYIQQHRLYAES